MASPTTGNLNLAVTRLLTTAKVLRSFSSQVLGSFSGIHKIILWIVLILNLRSLPFAWHIRVFWPTITLRLHYYRCLLPYFFKPRSVFAAAKESWYDSITPIGSHPFEYVTVHKAWAGIDDGDFMGHLSNSSYAKVLDTARFKTALAWFPNFFRAGGWMALAGTHFSFIREIPTFTSFEVRLTTFGWDNKWFFVIARFVSKTKPTKSTPKDRQTDRPGTPDFDPAPLIISGSTPPLQLPIDRQSATTAAMAANQLAASILQAGEADGSTLHCVHISQTCFKLGRVTIPPSLVLATNGFASPPSPPSPGAVPTKYSRANPPPHWKHVKALRCPPKGNMRAFAAFLKGGWRDVPEGERWWENALAGPVENLRKANMSALNGIRSGMESAKKPTRIS